MKYFLSLINWKAFAKEMFIIFAFFCLSYWAGNNEFPHGIWAVPVGTLLVGIGILGHVYLEFKIKKEKEERNGKNK